MPWSQTFSASNMYFNAIPEKKILAKISKFTVFDVTWTEDLSMNHVKIGLLSCVSFRMRPNKKYLCLG